MPFIGSMGSIVASWFGVTIGAASAAAFMVGGAIVGAAAGALISAVSGGDIFEGLLYGAIGGTAIGYGLGPAGLGLGAAGAAGAATQAVGLTAPTVGAGVGSTAGAAMGSVMGGPAAGGIIGGATTGAAAAGSAAAAATTAVNAGAGSLFGWQGLGAAAYVGGSFLTGKYDYKAAELTNETNLTINRENTAARERMHGEEMDFARYKFDTEFEDIQNQREVMQEGIRDAADFMGENMPTVAGASYNTERKAFIKPPWKLAKNTGPQADQTAQMESGFLGGNMRSKV